ncbi:hypothetical protein ZWY2020_016780 [Hordeum vulgare]|nr:hypothetical protein ZWY2020_016780 [Hordeum vulgare]
MEAAQREYNSAYGLTPVVEGPSRCGEVRGRGRVIAEILGGKLPFYETPVVNMRAAQAAMVEMSGLEGEERSLQEKRVQDLLDAASKQQAHFYPGVAQSMSRELHRRLTATPAAVTMPKAPPCTTLLAGEDLLEEEGPIGPTCFGPQIRGEPFSKSFTLPRDTPKYSGTTKLEDWLIDYTTTVDIARGNKRIAVRYVPLVLTGSVRIWLNSLPAGSVNSWVDFEEAFVYNFTGTYKRPGRPRDLAMCVQKPNEPLRDYVTCWTELHDSCEGVHEVQAIQYFIDGCRDGTLLKHKLMSSEHTSLEVLMAKADMYAATS